MTIELPALVIEDDAKQASVTASILEKAGFSTTVAHDSVAGINAITHNSFDLVIVDLHLPDMAGAELIQVLRGSPHGISAKIIAVTASDDQDELEAAFISGADDIYQKKVGANVLAAKFASLAQKFQNEARIACRLAALEQQMEAHAQNASQFSRDTDEEIKQLQDVLLRIDQRTERVEEIIVAWDQTKAMVNGIKATAVFINKTKLIWGSGLALFAFFKTGQWSWPK